LAPSDRTNRQSASRHSNIGRESANRNKFEIIQDIFSRPVPNIIVDRKRNEFFHQNHEAQTIDFKQMYMDKRFKFQDDFRIKRIKEIVEVEYGINYSEAVEIGRVSCVNYDENSHKGFMYEGELQLRDDGLIELNGFGNYIN